MFIIAILLVTSFYYHSEFYKLGWIQLLIIGSIITFITLKAILWVSYNKTSIFESEGSLIFKPKEVDAIKLGKIKQIIRPYRESSIKAGVLYKAKLNIMSDRYFSELLIKKIYSKRLNELTEKDVLLSGAGSITDFRIQWIEKYGSWDLGQRVRLIRFEAI